MTGVQTCALPIFEDDKFYILTHPGMNPAIVARAKNIPSGKGPDLKALAPFMEETHEIEEG